MVTVWVTPGQEDEYRAALPDGMVVKTGRLGVAENHNAATEQTPEGEPVVWCDDDLTGFVQYDGKTLSPVGEILPLWATLFDTLQSQRLTLWGIVPVANHFYMGTDLKVGLYFCIGQHYGVLNQPHLLSTIDNKDDYERSLLHYEQDGGVLRASFFGVKAKPVYGYPGGLQADDQKDRETESLASAASLMERWPLLVHQNKRRGPMEILLRAPKGS